jgi:hypothetical protein
MAAASWALQQAIFAALAGNTALTALLGGPRVYDTVPRGTRPPYVTFAHSTVHDWSTGTDPGEEHTLTLHAWTEAHGSKQVIDIMAAMRSALHEQPLALTGHRLVNLRHEFSEVRRVPDDELYHGIVRFRATTEPTP